VDGNRIDVRREPLVVRDGCAPDRIPAGRWPSDDPLVRSEQFAVNEAVARLAHRERDSGESGAGRESGDRVLGVHAPPGTGVAEVFGDLVAAIVTERARRIADLPEPAAAFGAARSWGVHTVTAPAPELAGFEIVLSAPGGPTLRTLQTVRTLGLALPPIGARWRDRATRADYFGSTARLSDGVGAWAMLAVRLGDRPTNRAFAERWWQGAVRGTDVLFPAGESMTAALRQLKGKLVDWPAAVTWFRSALAKAEALAEERMRVAAALSRLSALELACEEASCSVETAQDRLADLTAREPATRDAVAVAEEEYRATLAALGAHELGRPALTTVTPQGVAALRSRGALSVAVAGGIRRGRNWRNWSLARRELRVACATAERRWEKTLRAAGELRADVAAVRSAAAAGIAEIARLTTEMAPLAEAVGEARQRWGDHVPAGPSQAETEDPALIEWRETTAPWADEEYANARAQAFIAALELHKTLIAMRAEVFEANLAALMELISLDAGAAEPADGAPKHETELRTDSEPQAETEPRAGTEPQADGELREIMLAAWRSFFLVVPVVHVPFDAAESLFDGLGPWSLGWLLAGGADQLPAEDVPALLRLFGRAVFAGDTTGLGGDTGLAAQHLADQTVRYGTYLPACSSGRPDDAEPRWVGMPLRVVRGQDRTTVDRRNDLAYDGLLVTDRE